MPNVSQMSDMELLGALNVPPTRYTDAFVHHMLTTPQKQFDRRSYSTLNFQQYDKSNPKAKEQLQPAFNAIADPIKATLGDDREAQQRILEKTAQAMTDPMLVGAIKAFHGTPHTFPAESGLPFGRFKKEAIGSGEGAAAYGHGASYSAENPAVGQQYQKALSGNSPILFNGQDLLQTTGNPIFSHIDTYVYDGLTPDEIVTKLKRDWGYDRTMGRNYFTDAQYEQALDVMESAPKMERANGGGHLLELSHEWPDAAREAADPLSKEHLLDWDKPLSEQSEKVAEIIKREFPYSEPHITGQQIYNSAAGYTKSRQAASEYLHSLGIPGIKYLDGSSRGAGQGSHNFVMFEPEYTKIVARDGVPVSEALKGEK